LKLFTRPLAATALALVALAVAADRPASAKPKPEATANASASASPAPLPTATPEPPAVAIPRLQAKLKANPNDKDALSELAGYELSIGRPQDALALTQKLMQLGVKNAQVYYQDGIANESLGRANEAIADFENATNQEPTNAQILLTLTNLYLQTNRAADAERVAKRATTFNQNDKRVFENYGLVLGQEGKYDEARAQFETAAKLDPKDPAPLVLEARSYISQKAFALAGQEFDRALAIDPKNPDALLGKASVQAGGHDVKGAIATFEQLLAVEPTDESKAAVLIQEYQVYRDEKMTSDAVAVLKRAEAAYPKVAGVHIAYGDYDAAIAKDIPAAETEWKTALGPGRDNPDALQRLGQLALSQNKRADGIGYFKRLTEVIPQDPGAWATYGQLELQDNKPNDARDAFRRSFELAQSPQALAGIGTADLELKNYKECSTVFGAIDKEAAPYMKANPQMLYIFGKCASATGDKNAARSAYARFKPYVKPGSPLARELDKELASLAGPAAPVKKSDPSKKAPAPKATATPKRH
jgi:tetratricopeptide (TPR) repeat protein